MRQEFEMTDADLVAVMDACKPVMLIALQCGMPRSPQENANDAWADLGEKMKFDSTDVRPISGKGPKFFSAEVSRISAEPEKTQ